MLKLDDEMARYILQKTDIFKDISPNAITMFGMILNFVLLYYLSNDNVGSSLFIIGVLLFLRWLADCLDGNVARKYKKTSKIGNILDTVSDMIFQVVIIFYLSMHIKNKLVVIVLIALYVMNMYQDIFINNIFDDHTVIKQEGGGTIQESKTFIINNSYLAFIAIFLAIKYVAKN